MQRLRLYDCRLSDLPTVVGLCQADVPSVAKIVNSAQRRLLYCKEAGDEGWWGTFAEILFNVSRQKPYITLPREVARLEAVDVRNKPVTLNNQFFEYLRFGNGRLPRSCTHFRWPTTQAFARNNVVTFIDMTNPPQYLRVYATDSTDMEGTKRVLLQGLDQVGNQIYSQDHLNEVQGEFVTLKNPFVQSTNLFNRITGIQKDITAGQIQIFQVDPTTNAQVLLLTMEPTEQTALYRRYYFDDLPCSNDPSRLLPVTAIAKLDFIPVMTDTDYCLIQNVEALTEEAQAIRYSRIDNTSAKAMAQEKHLQAVRFLNGELTHFLGRDEPAIEFSPFGTARLEKVRIGMQ